MTHSSLDTPFHDGEREAQTRAGVGDVAEWAGGFIRDYLPEQHRAFHTSLPFLVLSGADDKGRTWVTLVDGDEGFIQSPTTRALTLNTQIDPQDPLARAFEAGADIGAIGIELATRRRNRFSGYIRRGSDGYTIDMRQTFGNCPQYINERSWIRVADHRPGAAHRAASLTQAQIDLITRADTLFIGSGHRDGEDVPSRGYDASHRGGAPGFVQVADERHLRIPDYAGNNFFNTIGNLLTDPRIGLVFIDFETGGLLHVSGHARIDWAPKDAHDPDARRMIDVEIDAVVDRPNALSLRWAKQEDALRPLTVSRRVKEAEDITSFYLTAADGAPLAPFKAGQHLPIELTVPGHAGRSKRSYSLSGAPFVSDSYRLSIKREAQGLVSRFFHDALKVGATLEARTPAGEFGIPCSACPLVLVSAGVGLTPMVSMLHAALSDTEPRPVWYVHGARNGTEHAMRDEVDALIAPHSHARKRIFYSRPNPADVAGQDYDHVGRISAEALMDLDAGAEARYMLCGPAQFVSDLRIGLRAAGVPDANIHAETFGPAG